MIAGIHAEVFLALCYALFLMAVGFVLEFVAHHSRRRTDGYRNSGFIYFRELDYWECPAGHQLVQLNSDIERRVSVYRAAASACNSCSLKLNCTDSDEGRLLERRWDTRIDSAMCHFHRVMSMVLLILATTLLLAEFFRYSPPHDREALVALLFPLVYVQLRFLRGPASAK
jgi:hypothetical protein